jgi:hypothetical protein
LPDDVQDLLDAERELQGPSAAARARMFERLAPLVIPAAIGAAVSTSAAVGTSAAVKSSSKVAAGLGTEAGSTAAVGLKAKAVVALIAATFGAVGGAGVHAALAPNPTPSATPTSDGHRAAPPLDTRGALAPNSSIAPSVPASASEPAPQTVTPSAAPEVHAANPAESAGSASGAKRAPAAPSLRDERLLLERASSALVRGDSAAALIALREHARRFPKGALAEEREVLFIRALRASGDDTAANRRAKQFKDEFPSSLQQGMIDAPASK